MLVSVWGFVPSAASAGGGGILAVYEEYYEALRGFERRDLEIELAAIIDDSLAAGSNLSKPPTAYKRRQIAEATLGQARRALCTGASAAPGIREACIDGANGAASQAGVTFDGETVGMVAAVCARLVELEAPAERCAPR